MIGNTKKLQKARYITGQKRNDVAPPAAGAYDRAVARVDGDPKLAPYRDLLVEYDWPEGDQHYDWVATAATSTLVRWAGAVRDDEVAGTGR